MRKVFLVIFLAASLTGCCHRDNPRDFDGDEKFEDYKPWWVTNKVMVVTNTIGE